MSKHSSVQHISNLEVFLIPTSIALITQISRHNQKLDDDYNSHLSDVVDDCR